MDVKSAFLHGELKEEGHVAQPKVEARLSMKDASPPVDIRRFAGGAV